MPSKISSIVTLRLKNEEKEAIDQIVELGKFESRCDALRALLKPAMAQAMTAIRTKSVAKAAKVRIQEEVIFAKHIHTMSKSAEVQDELALDLPFNPERELPKVAIA